MPKNIWKSAFVYRYKYLVRRSERDTYIQRIEMSDKK